MDCDILIVGGGLVGCAAAWHLACAGLSPLLVESGHVNGGASGQNAGSLHFQIERRFLEQGAQAAEQGAQIVLLNKLAIAEWAGLEAMLDRPLDIEMTGGLMVAETEAELELLAFKVARENDLGLGTKLLDAPAVRGLAPYLSSGLLGAGFLAEEGHANPRILADAFARSATARGAHLRTGTAVVGLTMERDGFYRATLQDCERRYEVRSPRVLLASGHWTPQLAAMLGLNVPLYPVPLTMSVTDRTQPFLPYLIQHVGKRLSMKQTEDGNLIVGGGWPSRFEFGADGKPDLDRPARIVPDNLRANLAVAQAVLPSLRQRVLLRSWTGTTCISADQLPIVGMIDAAPGLFVAAGGSMFTLGPVLARLLAQSIVDNRPAAEIELFLPRRFNHLNAFAVLT
ncbi:MAG: FAD-binding oxidoreductase [Sphingomonadales bacterium]|nr:MAG: FAD-binding oxidoreductase [Sphingomonadales bacterium]